MRKHLNQYVFSPLFWMMTLLLLILFSLVITLFTPAGPKAIAYIADSSFKQLTLKGVSGSVLSGLHVDEVSWEDGVAVVLRDIDVNITKFDIKNDKIYAKSVKVGQLSIDLKAKERTDSTSKDVTSLPNFGLPINIDADQLSLGSLQITKNIPDDPSSQTLLFQIQDIQLNKVVINDNILNFERLQGNPIILNQPLKINVVDGELNMNQPHEIKTAGTAIFEHELLGNINGNVNLKGTLTNYIFDGDLVLQQEKLGRGTAIVKGEGDYKQVSFDDVILVSQHGHAEGHGEVQWDPEVRWVFDVTGKNLMTHNLLPKWPANANTKLTYTGSYLDSRLENQLQILELDGIFRDEKITAKGQITVRAGLLRANKFDVQLGDNNVLVNGAVTEPLNLELSVNAKSLKQLLPELTGSIEGAVTIKGQYKKPEIQANLIANNLTYGEYKQSTIPLSIETGIEIDKDILRLNNITAKSGKNTVKVSGTATEPLDLKWTIDVKDLKQLSPQLAGSIDGSGVLKGTIDKLGTTIDVVAKNLIFNEIRQGKEALTLKGEVGLDKKLILLKNLNVASGKNVLQVNGKASEPLDLQIKINAQELTQISPDIAGRIQGDTRITGAYKSPVISTKLVASNLKYQDFILNQSEMNLQGEVKLVEGVPMIKELNSQIGDNRFQVTGRASSPYNLNWNIDGKNLKQIMPDLSGHLVVKGQLKGTVDKPLINATIDAKKISYKAFKLDSADFTASTTNNIYRIKGRLKNLQSDEQKVDNANLELDGTIENHTLTALIDHQEAKVQLKANGGWKKQQWTGTLQQLRLNETKAGDWKLEGPTRVNVSKSGFSSDMFCLASKKTKACSTASWSEVSGLNAKGTLREVPLDLIRPWLPEGMEMNGSVNGSYDIKQNKGKPKGNIQFKLPRNSFSFNAGGTEDDERVFIYEDAEVNATVDNRIINAEASMEIVNRGQFSANAKVKLSPEDGKHTIDGKANFDIPNINFAQDLIPHSRGLRGALNSKISFSGLLSKPQIKGEASVKDAYLRLPEAGTELTAININVKADNPGKAKINGKMFMGEGALIVSGDMDLTDIAEWKANIKISGNNIRFMNTNEIKATMSPDIKLGLSPQLVSIKGKIAIPYADIRLKDIPETSIDESSDTFVVGERKPGEQISAVKLQPNVKIELGNKVWLDAFGLKAKLSGGVNVTHNRRDVLANGSLRITEGKFQAYGQNLEINNGRLIFNGSPKLVGMDVQATREIGNQIVGVHLGGTLRNPKSKIFSEPSLSESEALSFLLTGHSLSTSSGQESALLMSAVRGLGITGNGSLVQNIGSSFGLDDVNIVSKEDLEQSELSLGKRLGPGLYVNYLLGLFEQTQKIAIEYKINKVLSLEAHTTVEDYSLDLIYEFERD